MNPWRLSLYICGFLFMLAPAKAVEKMPKKMIISHVSHPAIEPYNQLILSAYQRLGFTVEFIPVPAKRGLVLLNKGVVDADTLRIEESVTEYPNIILIQPAVKQLKMVLICNSGIPCSNAVFSDEFSSILTTRGISLSLPKTIQADIVFNENLNTILELLRSKRYQYAIYAVDDELLTQLSAEFHTSNMTTPKFHHVINKSHQALIPEISASLSHVLNIHYLKKKQSSSLTNTNINQSAESSLPALPEEK